MILVDIGGLIIYLIIGFVVVSPMAKLYLKHRIDAKGVVNFLSILSALIWPISFLVISLLTIFGKK